MLWILGSVVAASVVSFFLYWKDKRAAVRGAWRTRERTLLLWSLLGGWPGALLGQKLFRHKRRKLRFMAPFWACTVVHVGAVALLLWWLYSPDTAQ